MLMVAGTLCRGLVGSAQQKKASPRREKAIDPVCGLKVDKDPDLSFEYKGKAFYFCSYTDRASFRKNPEKYSNKKIASP
jgi:YHS domain-containing protein